MATNLSVFHLYLFLITLSCFCYSLCFSADRISLGEILRDGDNITSQDEKFVFGFFSPTNSTQRYVGIWYADVPVQSIVWVANRNVSISDKNGTLVIEKDGNLVVKDGRGGFVWSTNVSVSNVNSTVVLLDSGNLVIYNNDRNGEITNRVLWESFQHPTDTYLPDMRVYMDTRIGEHRLFRSWTSESDPSPGRYYLGIDPRGSPQIVIWDGSIRRWRSGHFNGLVFIGLPSVMAVLLSGFRIHSEGGRSYFTYTTSNNSDHVRFRISSFGNGQQQRWDGDEGRWSTMQSLPSVGCDEYNFCGNFAKCNNKSSQLCTCVEGFVPSSWEQWNARNWTGGCVRRKVLECGRNSTLSSNDGESRDKFVEVRRTKLPDFADTTNINIDDCKSKCLNDCSCIAYAFVSSGINCMTWSGELVDLQQFEEGGNTLYVRLDRSEFGKKKKTLKIVLITVLVVGVIAVSMAIWLLCRCRGKRRDLESKKVNKMPPKNDLIRSGEYSTDISGPGDLNVEGHQGGGSELTFFSFSSMEAATDNFSNANRLGQGGFGPVFKGMLQCGQEVAVKRLSRMSGQGVEEFKNEITLIAQLQHRNLVRLLGCCVEGEEKILLYEYMPNKSLDSFLFDPVRKSQLNWTKRFNIIEGIARGLLYLHRDSRLRIIHRDLKASNILLDEEMNPKISDFGMARIFGGNQDEVNTNRVVGTYGYMAPEYAMEGLFSGKSDVYSFGVLLLEIICGRRNTSFRTDEHSGIIGYAWDKWDEGRQMELVDQSISDDCNHDEALRCINLAMLCVQDLAVHRPNMSSVVLMLETENIKLPSPRQPTYTSMRKSVNAHMRNGSQEFSASNNVTISAIVGR